MGKPKTRYVCQQCGAASPKWLGRCPECNEWDTMIEESTVPPAEQRRPSLLRAHPEPITKVQVSPEPRILSGLSEFDRVLGGGAVLGSAVLIGGDPGIGKSTLLLQVCASVAAQGRRVLYVSSEESVAQTKLRAQRLEVASDNVLVVAETNLEQILGHIEAAQAQFVVVDSIQMVYAPDFPSAPGTVTQVRECGAELIYLAKRTGVTVFLIGHVTKEGAIAGPRVLEHLVDTVLYFEGERFHAFRILRAVKNRFGSTNEIGVFEMREAGLVPVENPSGFFLSQRSRQGSGSVVVPCIEGTRAFLVEVQALLSRANFGVPERKVSGADYNRVCMLLAVLEKRAGLMLGGQDAFVNIVGGVQVDEPAADLGIALAMASSFRDKRLPDDLVALGEVGLAGEVRGVGKIEARLKEAQKLGFRRVLLPRDNEFPKSLTTIAPRHVSTLAEAMEEMT
jgi:DNA repair protein RadA/Sms